MKCIIEFSKSIVIKLNLYEKKYFFANIRKFQQPKLKRSNNNLCDNQELKLHMIRISNLTHNFIQNPKLMQPFIIFLYGINDCITDNINWRKQMYHKEISFVLQNTCFIGCNKQLNLTNTSSQCIIYDLNDIKVGITSSKICSKCETLHRHNNIITVNDNIYMLPISKKKYFELSSETIFTKELLYDFGRHFLKHGMGAEAYTEIYNDRNENVINHINKNMQKVGHRKKTIKLERNKLSSAFFLFFAIHYIYMHDLNKQVKLSNNYNFEQICLNVRKSSNFEPPNKRRKMNEFQDEGKDNEKCSISFNNNNKLISITRDEINIEKNKIALYSNIMSKNNKKIRISQFGKIVWKGEVEFAKGTWYLIDLYYPIGFTDGSMWGYTYKTNIKKNHGLFIPEKNIDISNKNKKYGVTDYKIYWNILYDKYLEDGMKNVSNSILHAVPVINGIPPHAVAQTYGDGNEKIDLKICKMHYILLKLILFEEFVNFSKLEQSQRECYQCINMPYQGNASVISSKLCAYHFMIIWIVTGLARDKINKFIDFFHLRLIINKIHKKKNLQKQLTHSEDNKLRVWNEYNTENKHQFEKIISSLLYFHKLKKYRKITEIIQFKKPDRIVLNQSFTNTKDNIDNDLEFIHLNDQRMISYISKKKKKMLKLIFIYI